MNYEEEKIAKELTQIYSSGKSSDSPGSFRYKRAGEINSTTLSKNCIRKRQNLSLCSRYYPKASIRIIYSEHSDIIRRFGLFL